MAKMINFSARNGRTSTILNADNIVALRIEHDNLGWYVVAETTGVDGSTTFDGEMTAGYPVQATYKVHCDTEEAAIRYLETIAKRCDDSYSDTDDMEV